MEDAIHKRNKPGKYPHLIAVRISDRQYADLKTIESVTKSSDSHIFREALQMWLNQNMFKLMKDK